MSRSQAYLRLTRLVLLVTAVGSVLYAVGLAVVPDLLADLGAGPEQTSWVRYLVPIYLGLGVMAWVARRAPLAFAGIAWGFTVVWAGLAAAHIVNMALGDEPVGTSTVGLLAFDALMGVALAVGLLQLWRNQESRT
jgi:hypothetical protein